MAKGASCGLLAGVSESVQLVSMRSVQPSGGRAQPPGACVARRQGVGGYHHRDGQGDNAPPGGARFMKHHLASLAGCDRLLDAPPLPLLPPIALLTDFSRRDAAPTGGFIVTHRSDGHP
jgi:hypothetical protein